MLDVQNLSNDYQIILQETWLAKHQLDNLSSLGVSHFAFRRADYDFNDCLVVGGGTAIYWSKDLKTSSFSNCDGYRRTSVFEQSELCLIQMFLPYCSRANT